MVSVVLHRDIFFFIDTTIWIPLKKRVALIHQKIFRVKCWKFKLYFLFLLVMVCHTMWRNAIILFIGWLNFCIILSERNTEILVSHSLLLDWIFRLSKFWWRYFFYVFFSNIIFKLLLEIVGYLLKVCWWVSIYKMRYGQLLCLKHNYFYKFRIFSLIWDSWTTSPGISIIVKRTKYHSYKKLF